MMMPQTQTIHGLDSDDDASPWDLIINSQDSPTDEHNFGYVYFLHKG